MTIRSASLLKLHTGLTHLICSVMFNGGQNASNKWAEAPNNTLRNYYLTQLALDCQIAVHESQMRRREHRNPTVFCCDKYYEKYL